MRQISGADRDDMLYHLTDALGSVRELTDDVGDLVGTAAYEAFGGVRSTSGSSSVFGFTGELTDPTTGFVHLRARDYNPTTGRFLSMDTVQPNAPGTQGYNRCAYVANNPATWTDPSGHALGFREGCEGLVGGGLTDIAVAFGLFSAARGILVGQGSRGGFVHIVSSAYAGFGLSKASFHAAQLTEGVTGELPLAPHILANWTVGGIAVSVAILQWGEPHLAAPAAFSLLLAGVLIMLAAHIIEILIAITTFWNGISGKVCPPYGEGSAPQRTSSMGVNGQDPPRLQQALSRLPRLPSAPRPSSAGAGS